MFEISVQCSEQNELSDCPSELLEAAGYTALGSWLGFVRKIYQYKNYILEARVNGVVKGVLTLTEVRHPIFGNYLTTAPFASYGGFAYETEQIRDALLNQASNLRQSLGADYAVVRFDKGNEQPPVGWKQHAVYSTYKINLAAGTEMLLSDFNSNHRNHIRKSHKKGFSIRFGHLELLDDTYNGIARSMHELGSPYHHKKYLREMARSLGDMIEFTVVNDSSDKLVGSGVFIKQGQIVTNLHANILRKYRAYYAGEFLYWSVIDRYGKAGSKTLDLGRSLIGSGNEHFKIKWKPKVQLLSYWYNLADDKDLPVLNQKNPKFRFAIWTWKRLPEFVVRMLGPSLIRGLA